MIEGTIRNSAPRVMLTIHGEQGSAEVEFLVDTCYAGYLSLPTSLLESIGAEEEGVALVTMADGSCRRSVICRINVEWDGDEREVEAMTLEDQPLLGFKMMSGYHLSVETKDGGSVILKEL